MTQSFEKEIEEKEKQVRVLVDRHNQLQRELGELAQQVLREDGVIRYLKGKLNDEEDAKNA